MTLRREWQVRFLSAIHLEKTGISEEWLEERLYGHFRLRVLIR